MVKLIFCLALLISTTESLASSGFLDGKSYCRTAISNGMFGQPKGAQNVCLEFSNGTATDYNSTLGGNPPHQFPYRVDKNQVIFGSSKYTISLDGSILLTVSGPTKAGIIYTKTVKNMTEVHIPQSWVHKVVTPQSLANADQLRFLQRLLIFEIQSGRSDKESLAIINVNLSSLGLPEIQAEADIEIVGNSSGFVGSAQGATIQDSSHLYCLPCSTGRGQYEFGITELKKTP